MYEKQIENYILSYQEEHVMCKRGDIYFVNFGNNVKSFKQSGIRPALVVSNNKANYNSPVVTVVPLTKQVWKKPNLPTHVIPPEA